MEELQQNRIDRRNFLKIAVGTVSYTVAASLLSRAFNSSQIPSVDAARPDPDYSNSRTNPVSDTASEGLTHISSCRLPNEIPIQIPGRDPENVIVLWKQVVPDRHNANLLILEMKNPYIQYDMVREANDYVVRYTVIIPNGDESEYHSFEIYRFNIPRGPKQHLEQFNIVITTMDDPKPGDDKLNRPPPTGLMEPRVIGFQPCEDGITAIYYALPIPNTKSD